MDLDIWNSDTDEALMKWRIELYKDGELWQIIETDSDLHNFFKHKMIRMDLGEVSRIEIRPLHYPE